MKGVLHNFLGTFTSRYSDHRGYWLFGQIPLEPEGFTVNLLGDPPHGDAPLMVARRLAIKRFTEQMVKSGVDRSLVSEGQLSLMPESHPTCGWQGGFAVPGHEVDFHVQVLMVSGRIFQARRVVFVASHDPRKERRRDPMNWGAF